MRRSRRWFTLKSTHWKAKLEEKNRKKEYSKCYFSTQWIRSFTTINQTSSFSPVSLSSIRPRIYHFQRGHERISRIFSRRTQRFGFVLPVPAWRTGEAWRIERETERKRKNTEKDVKRYAKSYSVACREVRRILRIRRTSYISALLYMHISRLRSRRIDPSTPSSLPTPKYEIRFGAAGLSDRRAAPGDSCGPNKGSHPDRRATTCPRYVLTISRTRRQPAIRRRRRRNRRSAAISASSHCLSLSLSLSLSLYLSFPSSLSLSTGQPFSRSFFFALGDSAIPRAAPTANRRGDARVSRLFQHKSGHSHRNDASIVNRARERDACTPTTTRALPLHRGCAHFELRSFTVHALTRVHARTRSRPRPRPRS